VPTPDLTRTIAFRLTATLGVVFGAAVIVLLGLVYLETAGFLSRRVDGIITAEASDLQVLSPEKILTVVQERASRDPLSEFALFSRSGERVAGRGRARPADLPIDGRPHDVPRGQGGGAERAMALRLPWGEILIVGRDTGQLDELRRVILGALMGSGAGILILGGGLAMLLSLEPLRRVRAMQAATDEISAGHLAVRLPVTASGDELDALAHLINGMMDELERLVTQAETVGEAVAHELRTPLTRLRATLEHAVEAHDLRDPRRALLEGCVEETDKVLAKFRALLRIAAVEARSRFGGIAEVDLSALVEAVGELYAPVAAEEGIVLIQEVEPSITVRADADLMTEALSNLLDNALKFTPRGGRVALSLAAGPEGPVLMVEDDGPGIPEPERAVATQRFFRGAAMQNIPGHGLGLNLVAAAAALHGFTFHLDDAHPGLRARIRLFPVKAR